MGSKGKSIAVMQPYVFPYLGYFQLIQAVDEFVFYDDVNFIKRGWINRNRILTHNSEKLISFPCKKASQNKLINEVILNTDSKDYSKIKETIRHSYKKAPNFKIVFELIENILDKSHNSISDLATDSIISISKYLGLNTRFSLSSVEFPETKNLERAERIMTIVLKLNGDNYVNSIGGVELYNKNEFLKSDIKLNFLEPTLSKYKQFNNNFIEGLSVIDVLMFNSKEETLQLIKNFKLL